MYVVISFTWLESTLFSLKLTTIFFVCLIFWVYTISSYRMNRPQTLTQSQFLMCSNTAGILLIALLGGGGCGSFWGVSGCMQMSAPQLGIRSRPVRWEHGVLTTGLQGESPFPVFLTCTIRLLSGSAVQLSS